MQTSPLPVPVHMQSSPLPVPVHMQTSPLPVPVHTQTSPLPVPVHMQTSPLPVPIPTHISPVHGLPSHFNITLPPTSFLQAPPTTPCTHFPSRPHVPLATRLLSTRATETLTEVVLTDGRHNHSSVDAAAAVQYISQAASLK